MRHLCRHLKITANALLLSMEDTHDVELLAKIQYLMEDLGADWDKGWPRWEKKAGPCGCPHAQAKQELLALLVKEYETRTYAPEDTRRMHFSENNDQFVG